MFISKIKEIIKLPHDSVVYIIRIKIILCRNKIWKLFSGSALYSTKRNSCWACATIWQFKQEDNHTFVWNLEFMSNTSVCLLMTVKWRSICNKLEDIGSSALRHEEAQGTHIIGIMCGTACIWYFWTTGVFFFVYLSVE